MNPYSFVVPELSLIARGIGMEDAEDWFQFAVLPEVRQHTSLVVKGIEDIHAAIGQHAHHSSEGMPKRLRFFRTPHVKRYAP
jgi:hypothetical protein